MYCFSTVSEFFFPFFRSTAADAAPSSWRDRVRRDTDSTALSLTLPDNSRENRRSRSPREDDRPLSARSDENDNEGESSLESSRERRRTREVSLTTDESKGEVGVYSRRSRNLGTTTTDGNVDEKKEDDSTSGGSESYRERRRAREMSVSVEDPKGEESVTTTTRRPRVTEERGEEKEKSVSGEGGESWRERRRSQRETADKPSDVTPTAVNAEVCVEKERDNVCV